MEEWIQVRGINGGGNMATKYKNRSVQNHYTHRIYN